MNKLSDEYIKNIQRICQEVYTQGYNKALEETNIKELVHTLKIIQDDIDSGEEASESFLRHIRLLTSSALKNFEKGHLQKEWSKCSTHH